MSDFAVPIDGNIGLRVVKTKVGTSGFESRSAQVQTGTDATTGQPIFGNGAVAFVPISVNSNYTKFLPSVNLTFHFTDRLQLRLAASKGLTRPDFSQLNPNIAINEFVATGGQRTASSGNANLRPLTADQADASLEYYVSKSTSIYAAGFYKKVDGFIANVTAPETFTFGANTYTYQVTRPLNGDNGHDQGASKSAATPSSTSYQDGCRVSVRRPTSRSSTARRLALVRATRRATSCLYRSRSCPSTATT